MQRLKQISSHLTPIRTLASSAITMRDETNASGLKPEESKKLPRREPRPDEAEILGCIRDLYTCKPREKSYAMYAPTATFHDPVSIASPLDSIKSQFNGMPKVFSGATVDRLDVLQSPETLPTPPGPSKFMLIDQDVTYYRNNEKFKTVNSLLTLERDEQGRVIRHTEEWDHKKQSDSSDGFFGTLNEWRKKAVADILGAAISSDPNKAK